MGYGAVAVLWMIKLFLIYTLMVVVMPYIILRPILRGKAVSLQFLICVVFGNFYYMNMVLFCGLFHITSRAVYIIVLGIPFLIKILWRGKQVKKRNRTPVEKALLGVVHGENSIKFCIYQCLREMKKSIKKCFLPVWRVFRRNGLEAILFLVCMVFLIMYFAPYFYEHHGYQFSDVVVHQQWINAIDQGILFYDGIYPMGMHAVMYYIHAVFGVHTYLLMQFFPFVADLYIFVILLVVLKSVCRFRYLPYIGFFCLVGADYIQAGMLSRYLSALPQEFGMMFYLPCLTAAVQFFRAQIREEQTLPHTVNGRKKQRKESTLWLWVLIISFGLTLAVHFYITILAGVLVAAIAIGYAPYVFRPLYLKKLLLAAIISLVLPLAPMVFAFLRGTPLQGSLYWAADVMGIDLNGAITGVSSLEDGSEMTESTEPLLYQEEEVDDAMAQDAVQSMTWQEWLKEKLVQIQNSRKVFYADSYGMFKNELTYNIFLFSLAVMVILIPVMWHFREWEYSRILTVVLVNYLLMGWMVISKNLGLPVLMDQDRMLAFQAYVTPLCIALAADGCMLLGFHIIKKELLCQGVSFALTLGLIVFSVLSGNMKKANPGKSSLQTDGAAICLYDIIENYPEQKWTIVSCNEERSMMGESGWHYEVIDFLQSMEDYQEDDRIQIPTKYVFFYIEKESVDYAYGKWDESIDPTVSEEWASKELPQKEGISQYSGTNRIILNSRMYYWMQEYKKRYPNDIKVYYEDEEFICYFMEQNEYYLHNFAIDYGYNER